MKSADVDSLIQAMKVAHGLSSVQWLPEVDSTNSFAREFVLSQPDQLPALIIADRQTQGRGRSNHSWWSPQGCLMMTLALPASKLPDSRSLWNQLALLVGVSVGETVEKLSPGLQAQLKWPNDLYLFGRKTGGILIESFTPSGHLPVFLIGIGVNVDIDWRTAPSELTQRATCLTTATGNSVQMDELLPLLIASLLDRIEGWREGGGDWHQQWQSRCFLSGRCISVKCPSGANNLSPQEWSGRCEGVAADGQLLLRTENGAIKPISVGEVVLIG